ncbi:MAG: LemA family protein, partial [Nocardioidaceae bacterium]
MFEEVTAARAAVGAAAQGRFGGAERAAAGGQLDRALVNVLAVAEAYPDLQASANFVQLQGQLADTENQLSFARQYYNDAAATLNTMVSTIRGCSSPARRRCPSGPSTRRPLPSS